MAFNFSKLINSCNPTKNAGGLLLTLNALGMVFAAVANTFAAAVDKNTSKEDKKFLVPAGAFTGATNIGVYYLMTKKLIDGLKKCADAAVNKMSEKELADNTATFANNILKKAQNGFLGFGKQSQKYIDSMRDALFKDGAITKDAKDLYRANFKEGAGVLGAFIGAVVGCAIITPIIRDVGAYFIQRKMEKNNPQLKDEQPRPYFDPSHLKINATYYTPAKKPVSSMKEFMAFTNGGRMRI